MQRIRKQGMEQSSTVGLFIVVLLAAGMGFPGARPAEAALIEFTFGGPISVEGSIPAPWDGIEAGSLWSVTMLFDSETPDRAPGPPDFGLYDFLSLEIAVEGQTQATTMGDISVRTSFSEHSYSIVFPELPLGAGGTIELSGGIVFDTDELPTDLNLNDWTLTPSFEITGIGVEGFYALWGPITTFTSQVVPAPGAVLPLVLMGILSRSRKRQRSRVE